MTSSTDEITSSTNSVDPKHYQKMKCRSMAVMVTNIVFFTIFLLAGVGAMGFLDPTGLQYIPLSVLGFLFIGVSMSVCCIDGVNIRYIVSAIAMLLSISILIVSLVFGYNLITNIRDVMNNYLKLAPYPPLIISSLFGIYLSYYMFWYVYSSNKAAKSTPNPQRISNVHVTPLPGHTPVIVDLAANTDHRPSTSNVKPTDNGSDVVVIPVDTSTDDIADTQPNTDNQIVDDGQINQNVGDYQIDQGLDETVINSINNNQVQDPGLPTGINESTDINVLLIDAPIDIRDELPTNQSQNGNVDYNVDDNYDGDNADYNYDGDNADYNYDGDNADYNYDGGAGDDNNATDYNDVTQIESIRGTANTNTDINITNKTNNTINNTNRTINNTNNTNKTINNTNKTINNTNKTNRTINNTNNTNRTINRTNNTNNTMNNTGNTDYNLNNTNNTRHTNNGIELGGTSDVQSNYPPVQYTYINSTVGSDNIPNINGTRNTTNSHLTGGDIDKSINKTNNTPNNNNRNINRTNNNINRTNNNINRANNNINRNIRNPNIIKNTNNNINATNNNINATNNNINSTNNNINSTNNNISATNNDDAPVINTPNTDAGNSQDMSTNNPNILQQNGSNKQDEPTRVNLKSSLQNNNNSPANTNPNHVNNNSSLLTSNNPMLSRKPLINPPIKRTVQNSIPNSKLNPNNSISSNRPLNSSSLLSPRPIINTNNSQNQGLNNLLYSNTNNNNNNNNVHQSQLNTTTHQPTQIISSNDSPPNLVSSESQITQSYTHFSDASQNNVIDIPTVPSTANHSPDSTLFTSNQIGASQNTIYKSGVNGTQNSQGNLFQSSKQSLNNVLLGTDNSSVGSKPVVGTIYNTNNASNFKKNVVVPLPDDSTNATDIPNDQDIVPDNTTDLQTATNDDVYPDGDH